MRVALISDIHGNCFALDAALADVRNQSVDHIICLGDAIQGGPLPAETVQRLREISRSAARETAETGGPQALQAESCPIVMGNADAWLLEEESDVGEPTSEQQREVRAWTLSKLSADDLAFIRSFQPTIELALEDGHRLLCFHGSPTSYNHILLPGTPKEDWERLLGPYAPAIMTGGHTHTQQMRRIGAGARAAGENAEAQPWTARGAAENAGAQHPQAGQAGGRQAPAAKGAGLFFNPGSIGLVYDVLLPPEHMYINAWAEYAILTTEQGRLSLDFRRVPYDVEQLIAIYRASGRPHAESIIAEYQRASA